MVLCPSRRGWHFFFQPHFGEGMPDKKSQWTLGLRLWARGPALNIHTMKTDHEEPWKIDCLISTRVKSSHVHTMSKENGLIINLLPTAQSQAPRLMPALNMPRLSLFLSWAHALLTSSSFTPAEGGPSSEMKMVSSFWRRAFGRWPFPL